MAFNLSNVNIVGNDEKHSSHNTFQASMAVVEAESNPMIRDLG